MAKFTIKVEKQDLKTLDSLIEKVRAIGTDRSDEDILELDIMMQILKQRDRGYYRRIQRGI